MTVTAVFAFAVAILASIQGTEDASLASDRARIERIDARGEDGSFEVGEAELAELESRVASRLGIPAPWRVELRPVRGPSAAVEPCGTEALFHARLAGTAGATLRISASLGGGYVRLEWIQFLDEASPSPFVRDATRVDRHARGQRIPDRGRGSALGPAVVHVLRRPLVGRGTSAARKRAGTCVRPGSRRRARRFRIESAPARLLRLRVDASGAIQGRETMPVSSIERSKERNHHVWTIVDGLQACTTIYVPALWLCKNDVPFDELAPSAQRDGRGLEFAGGAVELSLR